MAAQTTSKMLPTTTCKGDGLSPGPRGRAARQASTLSFQPTLPGARPPSAQTLQGDTGCGRVRTADFLADLKPPCLLPPLCLLQPGDPSSFLNTAEAGTSHSEPPRSHGAGVNSAPSRGPGLSAGRCPACRLGPRQRPLAARALPEPQRCLPSDLPPLQRLGKGPAHCSHRPTRTAGPPWPVRPPR